jgi:MoxR-like ATPase
MLPPSMDPKELVASWLDGRAKPGPDLTVTLAPRRARGLAGKLRRAYAWITESAVVCPSHDVAFGEPTLVGSDDARVELRRRSYASYALLPLLNLATSQRLLFVGPPGRGKTTMATLMARVAGVPLDEVRRLVQHGHPQLTISDLLGSPLPSELIRAEHGEGIRVAWRRWIGARVKIIDEYNRIPTKTQSALLSLMAEGYAETFEQVVHAGKSAWFLTANDDLGGGTFPVIEALKDRIDIVVCCAPFNARHLGALAARVAEGRSPEAAVPGDIVFTPAELDQAEQEIRAVPVPAEALDVLGFFAGQLGFCRRASDVLELRTKDTLHLAGRRVAHVCTEDCPLDKQIHLCTQTENGVSARALQSILLFAKALAYFRGRPAVSAEDIHRVLPFVLHDKLRPNPQSAFFQKTGNQVLLHDRVTWIHRLFDGALAQHAAYQPVRAEVRKLEAELGAGPSGLSEGELKKRIGRVQQRLDSMLKKNELGGPVYDDLLVLKGLYVRYEAELEDRRAPS